MRRQLVAIVLAGCGRIAFDPIQDAGSGDVVAATCNALRFTVMNDLVTVPYSTALDLGAEGTLEIWVRPAAGAGAGRIFEQDWVVAQQDKGMAVAADGSIGGHAWYGGGCDCSIQASSSPNGLAPEVWHHVAFVFAPGGGKLFIDGVLAGQHPNYGDPSDAPTPLYIGGSADGYPGMPYPPAPGHLREMRISRVARYASSFTPAVTLAADGDTQALWRLDEGSGSTVGDAIGGPSGSVQGAVWDTLECPTPGT